MSFGVEMYLDTVRTPDIVLTSYRRYLAESLELPSGISSTGRLLSRFKAIFYLSLGLAILLVLVSLRVYSGRRLNRIAALIRSGGEPSS